MVVKRRARSISYFWHDFLWWWIYSNFPLLVWDHGGCLHHGCRWLLERGGHAHAHRLQVCYSLLWRKGRWTFYHHGNKGIRIRSPVTLVLYICCVYHQLATVVRWSGYLIIYREELTWSSNEISPVSMYVYSTGALDRRIIIQHSRKVLLLIWQKILL